MGNRGYLSTVARELGEALYAQADSTRRGR